MGTNSLKSKDLLQGGKPSSYGRKARRVMRRELTKVADKGEVVTDKMVDTALRLFGEK
tara:strand:- start:745 stop:918 length:174 start_codon:yes stop_codon:yes gene_type:complete